MVTRIAFLVITLTAALAMACGGSNGSDGSRGPNTKNREAPSATSGATRPQALLEPRSGPPGTSVTVTGSGWPAGVTVDLISRTPSAPPYASALTDGNGSFSVQFRIEKAPDGSDLQVGRFDLIARSAGAEVRIPFQVETRRPLIGPGQGG
jgi:hypothetical protein